MRDAEGPRKNEEEVLVLREVMGIGVDVREGGGTGGLRNAIEEGFQGSGVRQGDCLEATWAELARWFHLFLKCVSMRVFVSDSPWVSLVFQW